MKKLSIGFICFAALFAARAVTLNVVNVSAPAINCIFDTNCTVLVTDTTALLAVDCHDSFLQSRTYTGQPGAPAAGLYAYEYRLNLSTCPDFEDPQTVDCIVEFIIDFGPVVSLDYNGDAVLDQVFVVTQGGLGSRRVTDADQVGSTITFRLEPVCPGASNAGIDSTFFFGLVSTSPPQFVNAGVVYHPDGPGAPVGAVEARAPGGLSDPCIDDVDSPVASYTTVKAFQTFSNPLRRVGHFKLFASDNCDSDPLIYIGDSASAFVAGPFHNGDQVEIAKGPTLPSSQHTPPSGPNSAVIFLKGGARMYSVDSAGNTSPITKVL
jgi:hypothetical protein